MDLTLSVYQRTITTTLYSLHSIPKNYQHKMMTAILIYCVQCKLIDFDGSTRKKNSGKKATNDRMCLRVLMCLNHNYNWSGINIGNMFVPPVCGQYRFKCSLFRLFVHCAEQHSKRQQQRNGKKNVNMIWCGLKIVVLTSFNFRHADGAGFSPLTTPSTGRNQF